LVVSFCILLSDWFFFLASDWLIGRKWRLLIGGSKRVDLRFWKTDTIPTKVGVSLSLPQWKVVYSAMQVVDDLIS
jgi:hypothetical protein